MIEDNLQQVRARILAACHKYSQSHPVKLVAVSKKHSAAKIQEAIAADQLDFGENYLQEALAKIDALKQSPICWHYIGAIQSNKTRKIAENFSWVHTVDDEHIARRLNTARPSHLPPLNVCVQINISYEKTKSGLLPEELPSLLPVFSDLDRIKLRGLMVIPEFTNDKLAQEAVYQKVQTLYTDLLQKGWQLDTLSMGMSHDLEVAIKYGATLVRIGQAIFGPR